MSPFALRVSGEESTRTLAQTDCEVALLLALAAREAEEDGGGAGGEGGGEKAGQESFLHTPATLRCRW